MPRNSKQIIYEPLTTIPIDQTAVPGTGTVSSVSLTAPSILSVSGSPVTTTGTLGLTLATQSANTVFSGPTTGAAATPTFRSLVAADIPSLSGTYQPLNANLTTISGLTATTDNFIVSVASAWASRTPAQVITTLGLGTMSTQNASAVSITGGTVVASSNGLKTLDSGGSGFSLILRSVDTFTANRRLNITLNNVARTFSLSGDLTVSATATVSGTTEASTYTPTRSAEANLTGTVTMSQAQYMQVGTNTVAVSGQFTADPVLAATATSFEFTLPIASNIGAVEDAAGTAFCGTIAGMGAAISGSVANNTAVVSWVSTDISSQSWSYVLIYQVI